MLFRVAKLADSLVRLSNLFLKARHITTQLFGAIADRVKMVC